MVGFGRPLLLAMLGLAGLGCAALVGHHLAESGWTDDGEGPVAMSATDSGPVGVQTEDIPESGYSGTPERTRANASPDTFGDAPLSASGGPPSSSVRHLVAVEAENTRIQPGIAGARSPDVQAGAMTASESEVPAPAPLPERILHITNQGDRIVVTESVASDASYAQTGMAENLDSALAVTGPTSIGIDNRPVRDADEEDGVVGSPRPDYEDVYPGCPRVLPPGSDEIAANERLALYGCLYYAVCTPATDSDPVTCTWYLNQKI